MKMHDAGVMPEHSIEPINSKPKKPEPRYEKITLENIPGLDDYDVGHECQMVANVKVVAIRKGDEYGGGKVDKKSPTKVTLQIEKVGFKGKSATDMSDKDLNSEYDTAIMEGSKG